MLYITRYLILAALFAPGFAWAHAETGVTGGLLSGLMHPINGLDHLLAMVAVGLWGAQLRQPAIWLLPITFPLIMTIGGLLGLAGTPLPYIEIAIALSALVLGLMVALNARMPVAIAMAVVGVFALFHGHAHGTEIPHAANPLAYGVGFVVATGLLHLAGIVFGTLTHWPWGANAVRLAGVGIATLGGYFLALAMGVLS